MSFFQKFFKPKWQHRNSEIRKQALLQLDKKSPEAQEIFAQVAQNDISSELRQLAIRRLKDIKLIQAIAKNNDDLMAKELAFKIWCQYLAGISPLSPAVEIRCETIRNEVNDDKILEFIITEGEEIALRLAALSKINRESLLGDAAIQDRSLEVRQTALNKIQQKSTLERIYKATRTKDKKISRESKARLDAILAEEEKPSRLREERRQICLSLEILGKKGEWEREKGQQERLIKQWTEIEGSPDETILTRFNSANDAFTSGYHGYLARQAERLARDAKYAPLRDTKLAYLTDLEAIKTQFDAQTELTDEQLSDLLSQVESVDKKWRQLDKLPPEDEESLQTSYQQLYAQSHSPLSHQRNERKTIKSLASICEQAEKLVKSRPVVQENNIRDLEKRWQRINIPLALHQANEYKNRYQNLLSKLKSRIHEQKTQTENSLKELQELIEKIDDTLASGSLQRALDYRVKAQKLVTKLEKLSAKSLPKWRQKLTDITRQVNELNEWRSWANTPQKEKLCEEVEALIGRDESPPDILQAIKTTQAKWKKLGPSDKDSSQELWERFQDACEKAYEPCKAYFADQASLRKEALQKREVFLTTLSKFLNDANWETVDWKTIEQLEHQTQQEWQNIGTTDRKHRPALSKRFNGLLKELRTHIRAEWDKNLPKKQAIVTSAKTLIEEKDLPKSIEKCKELQNQWKHAGRISQKNEQALWKEFRTSCDLVFSRRDQQREQQNQERQANIDQKNQLIEQLESWHDKISAETIKQIDNEVRKIEEQWQKLPSINKDTDHGLNARHKTVLSKIETAKENFQRTYQLVKLSPLRQKAKLCQQLEAIIFSQTSTEKNKSVIADIIEQWAHIETLDNSTHENQLTNRMTQLQAITNDLENQTQTINVLAANNIANLRALCIRMEIATGIDSPTDAATERLEHQVARLASEMGTNSPTDQWQQFVDLETQWGLAGHTPEKQQTELNSRHQNVLRAMQNVFPHAFVDYPLSEQQADLTPS